jgi:hypothetical protein
MMERDEYGDMFRFRLGQEVRTADEPARKQWVTERRWTQRRILGPVVEYRLGTSADAIGLLWFGEDDMQAWE